MILLTGATGLLGSHILYDLLLRGEEVRALYRSEDRIDQIHHSLRHYNSNIDQLLDRVDWFQGDILDVPSLEEAMKNVDRVIHAAAMVSFNPSDKYKLFKINGEGTANVVNTALSSGVKRFIHISSVAALGRKGSNDFIDEEIVWEDSKHNSNYAISKYIAEKEVWRGIEEGLNAAMINPCVILGAGNWRESSAKLLYSVYKGFPFYSSGSNAIVDARDVSKMTLKLIDSNIVSERFIAIGENISFKNLLFKMADALEVKRPSINPPQWLIGLVWRWEWLKSKLFNMEPLLTKETALAGVSISKYDNSKARERLDMNFRSVDETIADLAEMLKKDMQS
jgi:nucleoside-diphosphate-sugar epimerase